MLKKITSLLVSCVFTTLLTTSCINVTTASKYKKVEVIQEEKPAEPKPVNELDPSLYSSYALYKDQVINFNPNVAKNNSVSLYSHLPQKLSSELKIAILTQDEIATSPQSQAFTRDVKAGMAMFLEDTKYENLLATPFYTKLSPSDVAENIKELSAQNFTIVISTLPSKLLLSASGEIVKHPSILFISLSSPASNSASGEAQNALQNLMFFSPNPQDQIFTITEFVKYNGIKNLSFLLPNTVFGGDVSSLFSKSIASLANSGGNSLEIQNAEFFTNSTNQSKVDITTAPQLNETEQPTEGQPEQQPEDLAQQGSIKTNIPYYLKKILFYHSKKLDSIQSYTANFNPEVVDSANPQPYTSVEQANSYKKLAVFFAGSEDEKLEFMKLLAKYKKNSFYNAVFENTIFITDSTLEDAVANLKNSPEAQFFNDIFAPYINGNESEIFSQYFTAKLGFAPSKISTLLYDSMSFATYIFAKKKADELLSNTALSLKGKFYSGIMGDFLLEPQKIRYQYSFIYIDKNGNFFKV